MRFLKPLFINLILVSGVACIGTGLWWVAPWASMIAIGAFLLLGALCLELGLGAGR